MTFGTDKTDFSNDDIPDTNDPDDSIFTFWDDIDLNNGATGKIYYETRTTASGRIFIVEWYDVPHIKDDPGDCAGGVRSHYTFQAILYEITNDIKFQYLSMVNGCKNLADGRSATVGIENIDGTIGLKYSYNTSSIYDRLAICFSSMGTNCSLQRRHADTNKPMMGRAINTIKDAKDLLSKAEGLCAELKEKEDPKFDECCSEDKFKEAKELLEMAEKFFSGGNYIAANNYALRAIAKLEEIIECCEG
ncbi:MAG: hypothetical protein ACE5K0_02295 [Candidatus Methanofastidiosia archaeon]